MSDDAILGTELMVVVMVLLAVDVVLRVTHRDYRNSFPIARKGLIAFAASGALHLLVADEAKKYSGFKNLSADAFGPFTTLMGLLFSVLLGQTYQYYFDRQGSIQDSTFKEIAHLSRLSELCRPLCDDDAYRQVIELLLAYGRELGSTGLSTRARLVGEEKAVGWRGARTNLAGAMAAASGKAAPPSPRESPSRAFADVKSLHLVLPLLAAAAAAKNGAAEMVNDAARTAAMHAVHHALRDVDDARAQRVSQISADLPVMQWRTLVLLGFAQLFSFLLLDLSAPHLEALLFGLVTAASSLFYFVIADLSDPFGGFWSVEPAVTELATLELRLKRERPDAGARVLPASVGSSRNIRI